MPVLISILITLSVSMVLLREKGLKITYCVVTFYSVIELLKFAIYPCLLWLLEKQLDLNQYLFLDRQLYGQKMFYAVTEVIEVVWNILFGFMIILTAKMLRKLIDESNKKIEVSIYQDRIKKMEQHIGEIENLYAGIRGMKHDMKNYIADMEALMNDGDKKQSNQTVLKQYLT